MPKEYGLNNLQEVRVVHKLFFQYDRYIEAIKKGLGNIPRLQGNYTKFKDGSPWCQIILGKGTEADLLKERPTTAFVPFWISEQFACLGDNLFAVEQVGNALTHQERNRPSLVDQIIGIAPYIELRQDRDSISSDGLGHKVGEAINDEIIANNLANSGYGKLVLLDPHSQESLRHFDRAGITHLDLTSAPLFADFLEKKKLIDKKSAFVALDKGSLQRCLYLCDLLGLDPRDHIIVLNKNRSGQNHVDGCEVLYGDPRGRKLIIFDDVIDTTDSIGKTSKSLIDKGAEKGIVVMAVHGVLSHPARDNIERFIDEGIISRLVLTDSLPNASFNLEGIKGVQVIHTALLMTRMAQFLALTSPEEIKSDPELSRYVLEPRNKEEICEEFQAMYLGCPMTNFPS
jgi:phosphoribosylpyrophosphate synthetase